MSVIFRITLYKFMVQHFKLKSLVGGLKLIKVSPAEAMTIDKELDCDFN